MVCRFIDLISVATVSVRIRFAVIDREVANVVVPGVRVLDRSPSPAAWAWGVRPTLLTEQEVHVLKT